jgi:intraflagellar transport protein 88
VAKIRGNLAEALEKAKEASNKEKTLRRLREQQNTVDAINLDLAYCVALTLACQMHSNGMLSDALAKYNEIIKSKQYPQVRLIC